MILVHLDLLRKHPQHQQVPRPARRSSVKHQSRLRSTYPNRPRQELERAMTMMRMTRREVQAKQTQEHQMRRSPSWED